MPYATNYRLRAIVENDSLSMLTIDQPDFMPRKGESELARTMRCYGIDYALDILESGYYEDGCESMLQIRGRIGDEDDPMFDHDNDRIVKTMPSRDLRATRVRWAALGRTIESVVCLSRIS